MDGKTSATTTIVLSTGFGTFLFAKGHGFWQYKFPDQVGYGYGHYNIYQ